MHGFQVISDPVRRRIIEILAEGEASAGDVGQIIGEEFQLSQPGVSQHLKVLRDNGFVAVRADGARRLYRIVPGPLREIDNWLERYRALWEKPLSALGEELRRSRPHADEDQPGHPAT
ncbi:winged helix-turn-helix transcriptional regulator [Amycolatopsis rhizosphaerae]|uniref:Winged helix-turn-helix transcriptional regulator n=1 Tax=Amycolatopsis rhizosphaerae TaxID=2053003 RepID=A0A558DHL3_9PSEU|nr:metalloregulator ArsR/SmtB family transcription factor [Amycolatopsis rhizosphaerae]TVT60512.1 winged helix-turn-helix transcriptional regulator [Amycolatopsis rhizosphaerae]